MFGHLNCIDVYFCDKKQDVDAELARNAKGYHEIIEISIYIYHIQVHIHAIYVEGKSSPRWLIVYLLGTIERLDKVS